MMTLIDVKPTADGTSLLKRYNMKEKNEFALTIKIGEDVVNGKVAEIVYDVVLRLIEEKVKIIIAKIMSEEHEIYIKPFSRLKEKKLQDYFEIQSEMKDDVEKTKDEKIAFAFSETLVDIWNKFGAEEFLIRFDFPNPRKIKMLWTRGMSEQEMTAYWKRDDQNGYNIEGKFWKRDWQRDEQKIVTSGCGGKV